MEEGAVLIVTTPDRLGRNVIGLCATVEAIAERGIRVASWSAESISPAGAAA